MEEPEFKQAILKAYNDGETVKFANDVDKLSVEVVRPELMTFTATLGALGVVVAPVPTQCHSEYEFFVKGIRAWIQNPNAANTIANMPLITFNVTEDGRGFNWFITAINAASLIGPNGPVGDFIFKTGYRVTAGRNLMCAVNLAAGWAGGNLTFGVTLIGDLIRKGVK